MGAAMVDFDIKTTLNTLPDALIRFKAEMVRSYECAAKKGMARTWSYHPAELTVIACGALTLIGFILAVAGILAGDIRPGLALMLGAAFPVLLASHPRLVRIADEKGIIAGMRESLLVLAERNAEFAGLAASRIRGTGIQPAERPYFNIKEQDRPEDRVEIKGERFLVLFPREEPGESDYIDDADSSPVVFSILAGRVEPVSAADRPDGLGVKRVVKRRWAKGNRFQEGTGSLPIKTRRAQRGWKFMSGLNLAKKNGQKGERNTRRGRLTWRHRGSDQSQLTAYGRFRARSSGSRRLNSDSGLYGSNTTHPRRSACF